MSTTVKKYYNPSVNIQRDLDKVFNYIPTPNAKLIYNELVKQYHNGTHSFTIIGAYGTGKSSFLIALEKEINEKIGYFSNENSVSLRTKFEIIPFIGEYVSVISTFAKRFGISNSNEITIICELFALAITCVLTCSGTMPLEVWGLSTILI